MRIKLKDLPHPDHLHLAAAEGWIELGNHLEANAELERIAPPLRAHPYVLELRYKIYEQAGRWDLAVEVARGLRTLLPENQWGHFYLAFSLHELKRTQEAYDVVHAVVDKFPDHLTMHYNLACYACQLGKLEEAMGWLERAVDLSNQKDIRQTALNDPDLEPLWPQIGEI